MQNSKNFGLSDSLIEAVKEALHPNQRKLDRNNNGKLDADDFKKLRGEEAEVDEAKKPESKMPHPVAPVPDKKYIKGTPEYKAYKEKKAKVRGLHPANEEVEIDEAQKPYVSGGEKGSWHVMNAAGKIHKTFTRKEGGIKAANAHLNKNYNKLSKVKEEVVAKSPQDMSDQELKDWLKRPMKPMSKGPGGATWKKLIRQEIEKRAMKKPLARSEVKEAEDAVAKQIAAKKEQMKKQIQQKIAQKQMSVMQQKAQKKIQSIKASTHDDMENDMKKKGKDTVEVNPELREAEDLPKKVIKKGHEIAKSLIKHKADVKEPYAVGMAQAKKSAGIKD